MTSKEFFNGGFDDVPCLDEVDCACKLHDRACSHPLGCSRQSDEEFIVRMDEYLDNTPWYKEVHLREKAKFMRLVISLAKHTREHRRLSARRLGMFDEPPKYNNKLVQRVHGNWCGPGWIGGQYLGGYEYVDMGGDFSEPCIDELDCACRIHDRVCATSRPHGCSSQGDATFLKSMKEFIERNSNSDLPEVKDLVKKAKYMQFWISLVKWNRKHM